MAASVLLAGCSLGKIPAQAIGTAQEATVAAALLWIKCNESLRTKSSLYQEAEEFLRAGKFDANLLSNSRINAFVQAGVDENPLKVCEGYMGLPLVSSLRRQYSNAEKNFKYMANWKKKSAVRMADYWCKCRTFELTESQLDDLYYDIVSIVEQEGVQRYVDDYAIESASHEISGVAGMIVFKRTQKGTCQLLN